MPIPYAACASLLAILLASASGGARADIHRRIDAASGMEVLSNVAATPAAGAAASALRAHGGQAAAGAMRTSAGPGRQAGVMSNLGGQSEARAQAASFPVISRQQQSELDGGRRAILEDELQAERQALQAARARQAAADILHRHDMNIAALTRELAGIR